MKKIGIAAALMMSAAAAGLCEGAWGQINQEITRPENWTRYMRGGYSLGEEIRSVDGISILDWGSYPSIDGSTVCVPMGMELARQLLPLPEEDLPGFVSFSTTHYAYERLIGKKPNPSVTVLSRNAMMDDTHPVDLFLGTAPSEEERKMAEEAGVELVMVPVCYDAFVFIVNGDNPVTGLTSGQIRDIYAGQITDWGELGGQSGAPVRAYIRPENSGSQTAMEEMVMRGTAFGEEMSNYISDGMSDLVAEVGSYDNGLNAIGYSYRFYLTSLFKSGHLRTLTVDGTAPTAENLQSGAYPYTVCYYAVYRAGDEKTAAFVERIVSAEGQESLAQAGYVPLN